jgi:hypothetical protein
MDHKEAFGSSYVARGGQRVAIDAESFMDKEAAGDEIAPGSLSDGLSSARVLCTEDVEGVLLPDFDGDGRAGRWPATVVPSARMRAKQSGCGGGGAIWKIWNNFTFWPNFKFPQELKLQILEQIQIWISLNFKGIQTFLEKSDKFTKILSSHDIPEYEFIMT